MPHSHQPGIKHSRAFAVGISLNLLFIAVEIFYGILANSSSLLADAGHNAGDVMGLTFAWVAAWLSSRRPKGKFTYGWRKTTILVSVLNALLLFGALIAIGWDAILKIGNPSPVAGLQVMIVAGIGVLINTATALMFLKGQKSDLNIRGAYLHMVSDAAVSMGVVVAGLLITLTGIVFIDSVASLLIIIIILWSSLRLFIKSLNLALDAVPDNIVLADVKNFLESIPGVRDVHDLHIWALSTSQTALTVHLIIPEGYTDSFLSSVQERLKRGFGIDHTTIQIEYGQKNADCNCLEIIM